MTGPAYRMLDGEEAILKTPDLTASLVLAAGRGSRMKGYDGNKTLLPLLPGGESPWEGERPILRHILSRLPAGPKALVVHHREADVRAATAGLDLTFCRQPVLNGTGGALLASRSFLETHGCPRVIVTMGDVPLVRRSTYRTLVERLRRHPLAVLGFRPRAKNQYGVLEILGDRVTRITEWTYWRAYPEEVRNALDTCNAGIYAARNDVLLKYLPELASHPHQVRKTVNGRPAAFEEYFITDLVAYLDRDGTPAGCVIAEDEDEVMGVDDFAALQKARRLYRTQQRP